MERRITNDGLKGETIKDAKILGFSDARIGRLVGKTADSIRQFRKINRIVPFTKQIDTLAAEWPTNKDYLYLNYGGSEDDITHTEKDRIIVLGSGCYRIGSSVEFDWCCVNMALALKGLTREVIMVNCNPETVSTDFDVLDKLYFEELTLERVLDIIDKERPAGVVVSVGGQTANNLTIGLAKHANFLASPRFTTPLHSGCCTPSLSRSRLNFDWSSALSILVGDVPSILACLASHIVRLLAVCPPTLTTTPAGLSLSIISRTLSRVSSSKYSLSRTSKSVDTVSGLQFTIITSLVEPFSASAMLTQHQSNSTLDPIL